MLLCVRHAFVWCYVCLAPQHCREIDASKSWFLERLSSTMNPAVFAKLQTFEVSKLSMNSWSLVPRRNLRKSRTSQAPCLVFVNLPGRCDANGNMALFPAVVQSVILLRPQNGDCDFAEDRYLAVIKYLACNKQYEKTFKGAWGNRFAGCPSNCLTITRVTSPRPHKFTPTVQPRLHFLPLCSVVCPAIMHTIRETPRSLLRANFSVDKHQLVFPQHRWWIPGVSPFSASVEIYR